MIEERAKRHQSRPLSESELSDTVGPLPRTWVNRASLDAPGSSGWHDAYGGEALGNVTSEIDTGGFRMVLGEG